MLYRHWSHEIVDWCSSNNYSDLDRLNYRPFDLPNMNESLVGMTKEKMGNNFWLDHIFRLLMTSGAQIYRTSGSRTRFCGVMVTWTRHWKQCNFENQNFFIIDSFSESPEKKEYAIEKVLTSLLFELFDFEF